MIIDEKVTENTWASLKNISVIINQKKILSNISINLNFGENIVVIGPNGSGKTTFLKLLNRSIYPLVSKNSSLKLFNKENINIWDLRRKVGFLFKEMEDRVNKNVNLYDLISSGFYGTFNSRNKRFLTKKDKFKIENLIEKWELSDIIYQDFFTLSDGQKRRALLARALVYEPKLLVLDEPFCNLDIKSNIILMRNLNTLINNSANIIYVTHSLETIIPGTNRVLFINKGKISNEGVPDKIIKSKVISDLFQIPIKVIKQNNYWRTIPF